MTVPVSGYLSYGPLELYHPTKEDHQMIIPIHVYLTGHMRLALLTHPKVLDKQKGEEGQTILLFELLEDDCALLRDLEWLTCTTAELTTVYDRDSDTTRMVIYYGRED